MDCPVHSPPQMSDTRAAIRELRSLSEKRSTQGLTEQEQGRLAELRDRLGLPSEPAAASSSPAASAATPPPAPASTFPAPPLAAASPRLDGTGASPLPRLDMAAPTVVAPELGAPPSPPPDEPTLEALPELETAEPVPAL